MTREELVIKIMQHMNWDRDKAELWMRTPNPQFGEIPPQRLVELGRMERLTSTVQALMDGQLP